MERIAQNPGRTITLVGASMMGVFFIVAFIFRRVGVSQDTLTIVAGTFAYGFLAFALVVGVLAWRRRPGGIEQAVSTYLSRNRTMVDLLGEPLVVAVPTEMAESEQAEGAQVNVAAVVSGPRGTADADLVLARLGRRWEVLDATVEHQGERHLLSGEPLK